MSGAQGSDTLQRAQTELHAGRLPEALALLGPYLQAQPEDGRAWGLFAEVLSRLPERRAEAPGAYAKALERLPAWRALRYNLGVLQLELGQAEAAARELRAVLDADPGHPYARLNLASALTRLGQAELARQELETLAAAQPGFAPAWAELSWLHLRHRRVDAAVAAARRAVEADPGFALGRFRLAEALFEAGEAAASRPEFDAAAAALPEDRDVQGKRLLALAHLPGMAVEELLQAHRAEGDRLMRAAGPAPGRARPRPLRGRRLRVGYVSADFHAHAVTEFLAPVVAAHDRARVELVAYDTQPVPRGAAESLLSRFDHVHRCAAIDDARLADAVRAHGVDVLIDLTGHAAHNRLGLFARRPAPVQWQWFGYPLSTGLPAFDARITDALLDPPQSPAAGEPLLRLPSRLCWAPGTEGPAPSLPTPALQGAPFTFGSFNGLGKLNDGLLSAWAAILQAVPGSRLRMGHVDSQAFTHRWRQQLAAAGVNPARLEVLPKLPLREYLAAHDGIDLMLDSFPFNGGTTTAYALWQRVPVLTLAGRYGPARLGASLVGQLDMPQLVVDSPEAYVERAIALASQPLQLQQWRSSLRERIRQAPLGQPQVVVGALENHMAAALEELLRKG